MVEWRGQIFVKDEAQSVSDLSCLERSSEPTTVRTQVKVEADEG